MNFLLLLCFAILANCIEIQRGYHSWDRQTTCFKMDDVKGAFIEVSLDVDGSEPVKASVLIIRESSRANFGHNYGFQSLGWGEILDDGGFKLDMIELPTFINSYVTSDKSDEHASVRLELDTTGLYCIYVAAPENVEKFKAPIILRYGHGFLDPHRYRNLCESKRLLKYMGIIWGALLLDYCVFVRRFKWRSISIVSLSAAVLVCIPSFLIEALKVIVGEIANSRPHPDTHEHRRMISGYLAERIFEVVTDFVFLAFCLGYGTVYYHKYAKVYRKFNLSKLKWGSCILVIRLLSIIIDFMLSRPSNDLKWYDIYRSSFYSGDNFLENMSFFLSLMYAEKTVKSFKKFTPPSAILKKYGLENHKIKRLFIFTTALVILLPLIKNRVTSYCADYFYRQGRKGNLDWDLVEDMVQGTVFNLNIAKYLILIAFFYIFWVRPNQGLVPEEVDYKIEQGYY